MSSEPLSSSSPLGEGNQGHRRPTNLLSLPAKRGTCYWPCQSNSSSQEYISGIRDKVQTRFRELTPRITQPLSRISPPCGVHGDLASNRVERICSAAYASEQIFLSLTRTYEPSAHICAYCIWARIRILWTFAIEQNPAQMRAQICRALGAEGCSVFRKFARSHSLPSTFAHLADA